MKQRQLIFFFSLCHSGVSESLKLVLVMKSFCLWLMAFKFLIKFSCFRCFLPLAIYVFQALPTTLLFKRVGEINKIFWYNLDVFIACFLTCINFGYVYCVDLVKVSRGIVLQPMPSSWMLLIKLLRIYSFLSFYYSRIIFWISIPFKAPKSLAPFFFLKIFFCTEPERSVFQIVSFKLDITCVASVVFLLV